MEIVEEGESAQYEIKFKALEWYEQIVDWFAIQFPKIEKVFNEIKNIFKEEEK